MPTDPRRQQDITSAQNTGRTAGVFWVCVKLASQRKKLTLTLKIVTLTNAWHVCETASQACSVLRKFSHHIDANDPREY